MLFSTIFASDTLGGAGGFVVTAETAWVFPEATNGSTDCPDGPLAPGTLSQFKENPHHFCISM